MILMVPQDATNFPTLGPQVCDFIEKNLVFGPGDLRGQPAVLDDETRGLIWRMYEVWPRGHDRAGRRRFKRCGVFLAKGLAKTEKAAWIAACELHPEAPVRCVGWTKGGDPIGGPVTDPFIPLIAFTQEQSDELAYTALRVILEEGPLRDDFDIGLDRILRKKGDGKAVALSGSPDARDGARTTFCVKDESHRWVLPRLKAAHQTTLANLVKRRGADPWELEITTAPEPGAGSVAEATMEYARQVADGLIEDASLFFFYRYAGDEHDFSTEAGFRSGVIEASGPAVAWRDIDAIVGLSKDPTADRAYLERVYGNRLVKGSTQAFTIPKWKELAEERTVPKGRQIAIGFDGALFHDSTGIVATDLEWGYQWVAGLWECPPGANKGPDAPRWQVPTEEVDAVVRALYKDYRVWRGYFDPPYWESWISKWRGEFGEERVLEWWTNRRKPMTYALMNFDTAIKEGQLHHSGDARYTRHLGNARRKDLPGERDEQGKPIWLIQKDRPDSPNKIDLAMAGVLSWEARTDAIAAGAMKQPEFQMIFIGGRR